MAKKTVEKIDIAFEASLLKAMSVRSVYTNYIQYIDIKRCFPNTLLLLNDYKKYYNLYESQSKIDFNLFYTQFAQNWHTHDLTQEDIEYYKDYVFPAIEKVDEFDIDKIILGLLEKQHTQDMSLALTQGLNVSKIQQIIDTFKAKIDNINVHVDKDVHTIENTSFEILDKSNGIPWFLPSLQRSLMSLSDGQFVVISADSGTGKTAFVIAQAVHAFRHLQNKNDTRPVLYFNSEGTASETLARFLSNIYKDKVLGGFEEIVHRQLEVKEKFCKRYKATQFVVMQIADVNNFTKVKQKIEKYDPALVIIDICDKLAPDEDPQNLKKLYDNLRVQASIGCPIIGTSQSGDTSFWDAEKQEKVNKRWLSANDLYGSKTGKAGASDTMIMIGKENDSNLRYISVTKKKRGDQTRITCELVDKFSDYTEVGY